ncbi:MAG: tetratricopeptide repeat protein [Pirellulales bacterium]|nr:tetratricopeptide repeat protein [Pirellulales bacterium]
MNDQLLRAQFLLEQSKWEPAEAELRRVLTEYPQLAQAHSLLALCLSHKEEYKDATSEAQEAIHLAPDDWFGHYTMANVLYQRNRKKEARAAVEEAVRLNPYCADTWGLLAFIEYGMEHWSLALAAADQGLEVDPEDTRCANARAMALIKLGRKQEAADTLKDAMAIDPEDAMSQANQGWAMLEQRDPRRAKEYFREALRLEPSLEWARQGMVLALKARNPFYRLVLGYFLWVSKLGTKMQWVLIIGLYLGYRALGPIGEQVPALKPYLGLVALAYIVFVIISWLADPLFNLLLRLDRFGRYVLSPDQTKGANLFGLCLLAAIISFIAGLITGSPVLIMTTFAFALLSIPCSAVYRCDKGWPRQAMALYTAGIALLGLLALIGIAVEIENMGVFGLLFFLGVLASTWVANGLITATPRY